MSKWITWQEILKNWRISPLDFYVDYIQQGLRPHTQTGHPLTTRDVMEAVYSQTESLEDATPEPFTVEGVEDRTFYRSKRRTAESWNRDILEKLKEATWADFEMPSDATEANFFFKEMEKTIYKREDAENYRKNKPVGEGNIKQGKQLRPSTRHKVECQKAAKKIWDATPPDEIPLTIPEMSERIEIKEACEGKEYAIKTFREWLRKQNPNTKPGIRKRRK